MSMHRPGAFAEFVAVPAENCHPLPDHADTRLGAMVEPVANAVHAVRLTGQVLPKRVIVFGAGPIGLVCAQVAKAMGAGFVAVVEIAPERLAVARQFVDAVINPAETDLLAEARALTDGEGFDLALDAVGRSQTRRMAVDAVHPTSVAVWVGLHDDETSLSGMGIVYGEKRVQGSYAYTDDDFAMALQLVVSGQVEVASWVQEFPLDEGVEVFWRLARGEARHIVKALLRP
jgi:L-iditol 2-dehydrogenase